MTTFASSSTIKTSPPLFTMFPGPSGLKSGSVSGFVPSWSNNNNNNINKEEVNRLPSSHPVPPVRPLRHVQHASSQWAETSTVVAPGGAYVVSSKTSTATVSREWSSNQFSTSSEISTSSQFQTIRTQTISAATSQSSEQYLDDLKLPTQQLDLAAQLGKGCIGRKGSLGGRRPPTIRSRRSSQGSLLLQQQDPQSSEVERMAPNPASGASGSSTTNGAASTTNESVRTSVSSNGKIPPPRPPPPVFIRTSTEAAADWNNSHVSRSATPPSLPSNSPPPLSDEILDFSIMDDDAKSESALTDVVEIHDKESVGEDGEVVRRRTIITLGPRTGSTGSINVTLMSNGSQTDLLRGTEVTEQKRPSSLSSMPITTKLFITEPEIIRKDRKETQKDEDENGEASSRPAAASNTRSSTVSAFNARRTIEQRRQHQAQQQQQHQMSTRPVAARQVPEAPEAPPQSPSPPPPTTMNRARTPPSTYLFGEFGSPTSSSISIRTMSISMSFDDLESNNSSSAGGVERRPGGARRSEAWYERRQSYGFEAAEKLQSLLNTSGSSDVPSGVSRSCDSLSSTVRSTSSQLEKMIPPWIKNPSPASNTSLSKQTEEEIPAEDHLVSSQNALRASDFFSESQATMESFREESISDDDDSSAPPFPVSSTPTSPLQRSESSRSATNILDGEAEPVWLRDLKVRRSLRETRRKPTPPQPQAVPTSEPVWLAVKLRPTGLLNLIDSDPTNEPISTVRPNSYTPVLNVNNSPNKSMTSAAVGKAPSAHLRKTSSGDSLPVGEEIKPKEKTSTTSTQEHKLMNQVKEQVVPTTPKTTFIKVQREEDEPSKKSGGLGEKLNHHRSIELMRMLEETPLIRSVPLSDRFTDAASTIDDLGSVYSIGTECSSNMASAMNSSEDLTRKVKKVAFGKDVKEESDRKRTRPRRIRARSPEARLRQWQEKLEVASKVTVIEPGSAVPKTSTTAPLEINLGLPLTRFGDEVTSNANQGPKSPESPPLPNTAPSTTSNNFRSLLQARAPYVILHQQGAPIETVSRKSSNTEIKSTTTTSVKAPSIVNGIVNFDSSVEQKITILETERIQSYPPPKSILKKRSMENLLDEDPIIPPPTPFGPAQDFNSNRVAEQQSKPRINVIITNQTNLNKPFIIQPSPAPTLILQEPEQPQEVLPWRIHLKHIDPPLIRARSPELVEPIRPPWAPLISPERKKTLPSPLIRPHTPEDFFRSEAVRSSTPVPGVPTAFEIIRNIRQKTPPAIASPAIATPAVTMVARCQVKEPVIYQKPLMQESKEPLKAGDLGYHSLEHSEVLNGEVQGNKMTTRTIDETIARLNETIEEIRSVDHVIRSDSAGRRSVSPGKESRFSPKRETTPPIMNSVLRETSPLRTVNGIIPTDSAVPLGRRISLENRISPLRSVMEKEKHPSAASLPMSPSVNHIKESRIFSQSSQVSQSAVRMMERRQSTGGSPASTPLQTVRKLSLNECSSPTTPRTALNAANKFHSTITTSIKSDHRERDFFSEDVSAMLANSSKPAAMDVLAHQLKDLRVPEAETSVEELVNKFEGTKTITTTSSSSMESEHINRSKTSVTESVRKNSRQEMYSSMKTNSSKKIELTGGMPEDKAALLVRKFFVNDLSVLEPAKKSRLSHPVSETIAEESSNSELSESPPRKKIAEEKENVIDSQVNAPPTYPADSSLDSDDFFRSASVATNELLSCSSFGSALDMLMDDDRSIRTTSSVNTLTQRYSSCSERSVRLSDIINRSLSTNLSKIEQDGSTDGSNTASDAVSRTISIATSETASLATTTDETRSTTSGASRSLRRPAKPLTSSTQQTPPVLAKRLKNGAVTKSTNSTVKEPRTHRMQAPSPAQVSTASHHQRRASSRSSTESTRTVIAKPAGPPPVRPMRTSTSGKAVRSGLSSSSTRTASVGAKVPSEKASTLPAVVGAERKSSASSLTTSSTNGRANRLVTITSYSSRGSSAKPEEAVTGIRVTPVSVGFGHYKIRMEQRIPPNTTPSRITSTATRIPKTIAATSSSASKRIAKK